MIFKSTQDIAAFTAPDHTVLKEVLHPDNDGIDLPYSLASAKLLVGTASLPHRLKSKELYYFLSGEGVIYVDGVAQAVQTGDIVLVPGNAEQYVENKGAIDLSFLCIVSPKWQAAEDIPA
ncbi:MAG: cupin domain-containing protein [Saprospiraceae bacterium]